MEFVNDSSELWTKLNELSVIHGSYNLSEMKRKTVHNTYSDLDFVQYLIAENVDPEKVVYTYGRTSDKNELYVEYFIKLI
jgi:hypothetical protein